MKKFIEEFKAFISRGNVLDMAIGVVVGGAFGAITGSLVSDVVTPLLAVLFKSPNTDALNITLRAATEEADAVVVLFSVIKAVNKARDLAEKAKKKEEEEEAAAEPEEPKPTTEDLLGAILEELKKKD